MKAIWTGCGLRQRYRIRVLMFDAPYNREVKGENVMRVKSWKEVEKYIKRMDK